VNTDIYTQEALVSLDRLFIDLAIRHLFPRGIYLSESVFCSFFKLSVKLALRIRSIVSFQNLAQSVFLS